MSCIHQVDGSCWCHHFGYPCEISNNSGNNECGETKSGKRNEQKKHPLCPYINEYGVCECEVCPKRKIFYYINKGIHTLASHPNGKCYCGGTKDKNDPDVCANWLAYGTDCQGFP